MELWNVLYVVLCCVWISVEGGGDKYDYIIVGGGVAGSVLAARLSEDKKNAVLLLEAGGEATDPFIRFTKTWFNVVINPKLAWGYVLQPQNSTNRTSTVNQGKLLGGCGSHNGGMYIRGSPHDYDRWAEMGNIGWSYNDVLPYFKKSEMMQDNDLAANGYHGIDGLMKTRPVESPIIEELIKAGVELGFEELHDYHGVNLYGIDRLQNMVDEKGERSSTYEAFLKPVRCRRNLNIIINALVTKVLFNMGRGKPKADGVYYVKDNQTHFVKAKKEVIICAGAIGSPALLMRSGIGPRQHLESLGINVISDLPVGNTLQDHISVPLSLFSLSQNSSIPIENEFTFEALFNLIFTGKSPWSEETLAIVYNKTTIQPDSDLFPYLEYLIGLPLSPLSIHFPDEVKENIRNRKKITKQMLDNMVSSTTGPLVIMAVIVHLHLRNIGTVRLRSSDPMVNPEITYEYLSNDDIMELIEGIRTMQRFINTNVMQNAEAHPIISHDPNCFGYVFDSDSYWECYIKTNFVSANHYAGSCKMAPGNTGVVDKHLRVKGVKKLRVADSSIMPMIISGHTTAPTAMIAEKAADLIQE